MHSYKYLLETLLRPEYSRTWLITGGAGYVGTNLTRLLLKHNQNVVVFDNFCSSIEWLDSPFDMMKHFRDDVTRKNQLIVYRVDVADQSDWSSFYGKVDHVVHLAAHRSVPHSYHRRIAVADTNVTGTVTAAEWAQNNGAKSFVYASSSSVYGYNIDGVQHEWMPAKPISPYSISKYAGELMIGTIPVTEESMKIVGLRFFNIYGPEQSGTHENATVVPMWIKDIFTKQSVTVNGDLSISRDFVHIDDVLQGILLASLENSNFDESKVFNIGFGKAYTLNEIVKKMNKIYNRLTLTDREIETNYNPVRQGDVPATKASISKAYMEMGYNPRMDIDRGLEQCMLAYAKQNQIKIYM